MNIERNSPTCDAIRSHLGTCAECLTYLYSLEAVIDCYRSYKVPIPSIASQNLEDIISMLEKEK